MDKYEIKSPMLDICPDRTLVFQEHINAHFLIYFASLLIARIIEKRLGEKYPIEMITETLQKVACSHLKENIWLLDYTDNLADELNTVFGTDFGGKYALLQDIKRTIAQSKNVT